MSSFQEKQNINYSPLIVSSVQWTESLTKERYEEYLEDYLGGFLTIQIPGKNTFHTDMVDYDSENPEHEKHLVSSVHKHFNETFCKRQQDFSEVDLNDLMDKLFDSDSFPEGYLFECSSGYDCIGWFYNEHRCEGCGAEKYVNTDYVEWDGFDDVNLDSTEPAGNAESL